MSEHLILSPAGIGRSVHQHENAEQLAVPSVLDGARLVSVRATVHVIGDGLAPTVAAKTVAALLHMATGDWSVLAPRIGRTCRGTTLTGSTSLRGELVARF